MAYDKDARTITVRDNGIGMSHDEVIAHIGTIAKSGTREFFASLSGDQAKDARLIGQFGVGFYSSFIVADRVTLVTRRAGLPASDGVRWESAGEGEYTIERVERAERGTEVTLHLREGQEELLSRWRLAAIIRKYSDHIALPIVMRKEVWDEDEEGLPRHGRGRRPSTRRRALWARPKQDITDEQYDEFYKHVAHDGVAAARARACAGSKAAPSTRCCCTFRRSRRSTCGTASIGTASSCTCGACSSWTTPSSWCRRTCASCAAWSTRNDLPLNVSREILQESRDVEAIRNGCVKRVLDLLSDLAEHDKEKYATFWSAFGNVLKEGFVDDDGQPRQARALVRFASTAGGSDAQDVALADYVARMKEGQQAIYYVTGDTFAGGRAQPAPRDLSQEGHRGAAPVRPHRRMGRRRR